MGALRYILVFLTLLIPQLARGQTQTCGTLSTCPGASTPLSDNDLFYTTQSGVSKKITKLTLAEQLGVQPNYPYYVSPLQAPYNAACNGVTNDTAAFNAAIAASNVIIIPAGKVCVVSNLVLTDRKILDCNMSALQAAPGSSWVYKGTGAYGQFRNCIPNDPNFYNKVQTTISATSPAATTVTVASATGLQSGMPVSFVLSSGAWWVTKIKPVNGISGSVVTIVDPVPSSATAIAVVGAGAGCVTNDSVVVQGGVGPPVTAKVTASAGAITGLTLQAPGLYSTAPSNPVTLVSGNNRACKGGTANLTLAGASAGARLDATWGTVILDQASYWVMENINVPASIGGIGVYNTATSGSNSAAQNYINNVQVNNAQMFGLWVGAGVNTSIFANMFLIGYPHGASHFGSVGFFREYEQPTQGAPSGGNHYTALTTLAFENGTTDILGNNDYFDAGFTNDTFRNYGFVCLGCNNSMITGMTWNAFSGPLSVPPDSIGGYGGGMYFGRYASSGVTRFAITANGIGFNAFDYYFADYYSDGAGGAAVTIAAGASTPTPIVSGKSAAILSTKATMQFQSGGTAGGSGVTVYCGSGTGAAVCDTDESLTAFSVNVQTVATGYWCAIGSSAGANIVCSLRINAATFASCTIPSGQFACEYTGPGVFVDKNSLVDLQLAFAGGASAVQVRGWISGL